jgi:hypothetical protein
MELAPIETFMPNKETDAAARDKAVPCAAGRGGAESAAALQGESTLFVG